MIVYNWLTSYNLRNMESEATLNLKLPFQGPFHIYLNFLFTMVQVMQCLIDLGALQPTGDLSSVRILSTSNLL